LFILFNAVGAGFNNYISTNIDSNNIERYREMSELLNGWLNVLNSVFVIILAVAVANTMLIAVSERKREFGILKALGLTRRQLRELVLLEALAITGLAFIIGCALGILFSFIVDFMFWQSTGDAGGIAWFFAPTEITPGIILGAAFISMVIGTLAALFPAILAGTLQPAEALRYE
jgi:ABC-type antimicrobial peptide transport system permease subunit